MEENYKDIFKRRFDDHEDEIDPQIIWDNIRPKRKSRLVWWRLGLVLVLLLAPIVYLYLQNDQWLNEKDQASEFVSSGEDNIMEIGAIDASANENSISEVSFNNSQGGIPGKEETKTKSQPEKTFTEVNKRKVEETNKIVATQKDLKQKNVIRESRSASTVVVASSEERQNDDRKIPTKKDIVSDLLEVNAKNKQDGSHKILDSSNSEIGLELLNSLSPFLLVTKQTTYNLGMTPIAYVKVKEDHVKDIPSRGFSMGVSADYGILNTVRESNSVDLLLGRLNTLENLESLRFNTLLTYHFGSRISLSSGLQYTRLNELFRWQGTFLSSEFGEYIDTVEETADGTILTLVEGEHEVEITRNMRIYNKSNLVSVPLILNLSQGIGKFNFSISGGVEANLLQWRDGYVVDEQDAPIALQDQEQSDFGLSYLGRFGVEYRFAEDLSLSANVGYVQLNHSELNLNTLYKVKTFGLGLRYFLSK